MVARAFALAARRDVAGRWRMRLPVLGLIQAMLVALLAGSLAAPAAAAVQVTFDQPTASSKLGESVSFSIGFTTSLAPTRVELLRRGPHDQSAFVSVATVADAGGGRFTATVTDRGHPLPNTTFLYRFRVITAEGAALSDEASFTVTDERFQWRVRQGTLITLHWYEGDDAFAERALKVGDGGIARATKLLGVTETEPIDFFIYADETSFRDAMGPGTRENVGGRAVPQIRTLFALIRPADIDSPWIDSVIPHELTHLVFGTAADNPYHVPPKWLNEGLAVYLEPGGYSLDWRARVESAGRSGTLIPLDGLTLQFPADRDGFFLGYAESVSAVDFFVRRFGQDTLVKLIRSYAAGVSDDDAFRTATGLDVEGFNDAWVAEMGGRARPAIGPQPAPPGPLPSDWSTPSATVQPSATPSVAGAPSSVAGAPSSVPGATSSGASGLPGASATAAAPGSSGSPSTGTSAPTAVAGSVLPSFTTAAAAPSAPPGPSTPPAPRDTSGLVLLVGGLAVIGVLLFLAGLTLLRRRPPDSPYPPAR